VTLDEIQKLWEVDAEIDSSELGKASIDIPKLHSKYYKIFAQEKLVLAKLYSNLKKLYKIKVEYFQGKLSEEDLTQLGWEPFRLRVLKSDLDTYLDADKDMSKLKLDIELAKTKVEFLESILKTVGNRTFQVRNAIDWEKFKVGN
jgi:hypothetical protein